MQISFEVPQSFSNANIVQDDIPPQLLGLSASQMRKQIKLCHPDKLLVRPKLAEAQYLTCLMQHMRSDESERKTSGNPDLTRELARQKALIAAERKRADDAKAAADAMAEHADGVRSKRKCEMASSEPLAEKRRRIPKVLSEVETGCSHPTHPRKRRKSEKRSTIGSGSSLPTGRKHTRQAKHTPNEDQARLPEWQQAYIELCNLLPFTKGKRPTRNYVRNLRAILLGEKDEVQQFRSIRNAFESGLKRSAVEAVEAVRAACASTGKMDVSLSKGPMSHYRAVIKHLARP